MIMTMHKVSTTWEVPERYLNLSPVGSGAFGQVTIIMVVMLITMIGFTMIWHIRYVHNHYDGA